jgi:Na+-transporting methylmalonyl-CoA/oxaloacetate decarboxylase gamma subunit
MVGKSERWLMTADFRKRSSLSQEVDQDGSSRSNRIGLQRSPCRGFHVDGGGDGVVVFTALVLLWIVIYVMDRLTDRTPAEPGSASAQGGASAADEGELIAVLTAAATAALGQRVRVRRVTREASQNDGEA